MENIDFKISFSFKTVWVLVIGNILLTIAGAFAKSHNWDYSQFFFTVGLILFFLTWAIILSDMVKNKIYHKTFWMVTMFIIPFIATIFYMIQRNKLIRLGQRLEIKNIEREKEIEQKCIDNNQKYERINKTLTSKNLIIINFTIVSYFILIYLTNYYKVDFVLVGVFRELLTIPFLLAQIVFLFLGIVHLIKNRERNILTIISIISLAVCAIITIGSFF